jgi:hypothetical protein
VWHLSGAAGLSLFDSTGNANNGASSGASSIAGEIGGAAAFASGSYISAGSGPSLQTSNALTMEAWVYPSSRNCPQSVCVIYNKENAYEIAMSANCDLAFAIFNSNPGWRWTGTGISLAPNTWSHVAVTYDGTTIYAYINGVSKFSLPATGPLQNSAGPLWIGGRACCASQYWTGYIDEVRLSTATRSSSWIAAEYNNATSAAFVSFGPEQSYTGPASSYAPITVSVNVAPNASPLLSNSVIVSGGGSETVSASDPTTIQQVWQ